MNPVLRVGLLSSEPIRPTMGGIGVRYLELARRLPGAGFDVTIATPGSVDEAVACGLPAERVRSTAGCGVLGAFVDRDVAVGQGQLVNELLLGRDDLPVVVDLYDPWLIENAHYFSRMGLDPYRNDHATWVLQMTRGDYFLCSSEEQRFFYAGFLTAVGRVNPELLSVSPTLDRLLGIVPFGLDSELPEHRPWLPPREKDERRLLFGGLYDWYDPMTAIEAVAELGDDRARLYFVRHPNAGATPQSRLAEVENISRQRGWWDGIVRVIDWVPADRRWDLLRDVDGMVATHLPSFETDLSMRTRFLDALVAGCPVLATRGGTMARRIEAEGAGWIVKARDVAAMASALRALLAGGEAVEDVRRRGRRLAARFSWESALAPLVEFLRAPGIESTKRRFAAPRDTLAPPDDLPFRLRRWLRRHWRGGVRR